ncbi:M20 family metallopeptidase [Candidatus Poribacteria bacterium]
MTVVEQVDTIKDRLMEIRADFHSHPELSFQEERTSRKIAEILREVGLDEVDTSVAKTGVVGLLRGSGPGKTFALRGDIDALPIQEENDVPYRSQNDGVMHACGHDIHITSVLGAAMVLSKMRDRIKGNVKFVFQPAEEVAGGAKMMIEEGVLEKSPKIDAIIGVHVWPGLNAGTIGVKAGPAMAAMDKFEIVVTGPGGHGAKPNLTSDPVAASAQIITALQTVVSRSINPIQPAVLSVCMIHGGDAFNIIPREVRMVGTVRTLDEDVKARLIDRAKAIVKGISEAMGVECEFNYMDGCPALINSPEMTKLVEKAGGAVVGSENVHQLEPSMGGEDFTYFARAVPGAMFNIGSRDEEAGLTSQLHRPDLDVNAKTVTTGVAVLAQAALMFLDG